MTLITEQLIRKQISFDDNDNSKESEYDSTNDSNRKCNKPLTLNLSFQKIDRMGNLCGFGNITDLKLNNNKIVTIAGLETLIHLKRLDFSFNMIKKIEGLSKLANLSVLSLYHNQIEKISGLERCYRLYSLSLGMNRIKDIETLLRLNHLKKLKDLVLIDNPICEEKDNYRAIALYHLPWLGYFDNTKVTQEEISEVKANEIHMVLNTCHGISENRRDCTHPLELFFIDALVHFLKNNNIAVQDIINQIWNIVNKYMMKTSELNDIFIDQMNLLEDQVYALSNEAIDKIVHMKDQLKSEKITEAQDRLEDCNRFYCCMMDVEIDLSVKVESLIKDFRVEWLEKKLVTLQIKIKDQTINSFMNASNTLCNELTSKSASEKNEGTSGNTCSPEEILCNLQKEAKEKLNEIENEDRTKYALHLKAYEDDFHVKHRNRICEIRDFLSGYKKCSD